MLLIRLVLIKEVLGWREYEKWYNIFGVDQNLCPELHTHIPDMHPHQCVSYALICSGVTDIVVRIEVNGTQHLCHPRFQPWGAGTPTKDQYSIHCGYELGVSLVMELLSDGHYKYYCRYFTDDLNKRCLIGTFQQGIFRCQFCKFPFFGAGFGCSEVQIGYDQRFTNPPRSCHGYCLECDETKVCSQCRFGTVKVKQIDNSCNLYCRGFTSCYFDSNNQVVYSSSCNIGFYMDQQYCQSAFPCLQVSPSSTDLYTCDSCSQGYSRIQAYQGVNDYYLCKKMDWNCDISRQSMILDTLSSGSQLIYYTTCTLCDPGYFYFKPLKNCQCIKKQYCLVVKQYFKNPNCILLDTTETHCLACQSWFALQSDGTCKQTYCDSKCLTCLDTNPSFCTTCDSTGNKIADNGICKCQTNNGLYEGNCIPCIDIYCFDCQQDFLVCISCKPGSNRIIVNDECICQPGTYDPKQDDQICLACDLSCLTCFGPSNLECTNCEEENISNRIQISSLCPCKIGYAEKANKDSKCEKCHPRCLTCFQAADETEQQYCLSCIPGQNRVVSDTFRCDCIPNYGDFGGTSDICGICDYTCGTCNNIGPTNCTQCLEISFRELTTSGECLCKQQYYDDNTDNIVCMRCHHSCELCANSPEKDACIQCPSTRTSNEPGSQFECFCTLSNTFDDGFSLECQQCDKSCSTCYGPLSTNCLTCDANYRQKELSSCVCPKGYYDIGQLECAKCHYSCSQCFDNTAENCIACFFELNHRILKGNICKCADGYYEELEIAECKICSYTCETCEIQPQKCLSCPLNSLRILDLNKGCVCPEEYFDKENQITCQKCHFKCKTCNGQDQNQCLSCDPISNRILQISSCLCQPHYFETEVQECSTCSAFCYQCINNFENCTSCNQDRYLVGSRCKCITKIQGATISTFDFNGMVICEKCHYSCGTCIGIYETDCISCIDTDHRFQVGNTCVCKEGYFDAGLPVCEKCSYKCKGCQNQSENCTSCQDNSLRQFISGFKKCQCINKYYDDGQNEICQKCHYSCQRCIDIQTKCEICSLESNRIYNDQLFTCDCDIGYYDNGAEICEKCHYSCLSCTSGDFHSCLTCIDSKISNRVFHNKICKCLFGYFDDGQSISCKKCDTQCLSCVEQSFQCLSCPQTRKIEQNCKCEQGYYDVGLQLCLKCNSNCQTCQITSNQCTSCDSDQFREINLITRTCDCQKGFHEFNGICFQCYSSCKTCSESIYKCTSCMQFRNLKNNDCICNDGMYESSIDKQCKLCDKTCLTCAYIKTYCLTCSIDNFRQFKSGNTCECIKGYFENPINQNCEQCEISCLTCSQSYDNCLTCDNSLNLSLINNKCLCQSSYFFDHLTNSCQQCNINCLECQKRNECTSCRLTTRHLDVDQKNCICNDGYFETNQQSCSQCHSSCDTCKNVNTHCLTCKSDSNRILTNNKCICLDGYYDTGIELCQKCNKLCKTCQFSASFCLSCYNIEQNRYQSGDKCVCKPGFFEQNRDICQKCSNECLTCSGSADYCTTCDINSKRVDQSIIHKCPCMSGFYQDQDQICQKCHIKCQTCLNQSNQCLSCNFQLNSNRKSLSDQCNCKDGYYDDGTQLQCQLCSFQCKTCQIKANNCQICQNSLRINPPICNCSDGYYEDEQLICQICASKCNTCILEPSNCLTCKPGRFDHDCKCFAGYFEIGQELCQQCQFQCATCDLNSLNCKTCKGDRLQEPQCICQSGYFDDHINENCQKCDSTCLECNINGCLSCNANRILNEEMNCIPPPNSIWYDNTPWCSTCQVAVVNAYLSDDISKIIIHFDFPLNPNHFNQYFEINKCLQIFESKSSQSFGQNSVCYLNPENEQELLILLGEYSTINVGDVILFKSNSLTHINCQVSLQKFIFTKLQYPINPLPPQIEYLVPLHQLNPFADNSIYLKSIKNNGNRKLFYIIWSCQVQSKENSSVLNKFLDDINKLQECNLLIPKFTLPGDALIKFKIKYYNFINIYSQSEFVIKTHAGDLPQININVKLSYFVFETIKIGVSVGNLDQSIQKNTTKYKIQINEIDRYPKKSTSSQLNSLIESNYFELIYFTISKYILSPNSTYTYQVIATNLDTKKSQQQNFTFDIPLAGLICQFNNIGYQNIRRDLNLQILCEDLDTTYKQNSDPDLFIQVVCKDLTLNQICQNQQKQIINVNQSDTFQFIRKNSISSFTVQEWTVTATKFKQKSKFALIIVYLENDFPSLQLEFNKGYLMRQINNYEQLNFTYLIPFNNKYNLLDLSIAIIYNYEIIEILQPKYISYQFQIFNKIKEFNFGDDIKLKFSAQYTNNIMPSIQNIKLTINQPPLCSKLRITPSSDLALTNISVAAACQQLKDFPYKYQLRLFLRELDLIEFLQGSSDNSLVLYPFQTQNQFLIQTPSSVDSSKIGILVEVLDSRGSITNIFDMINVRPANINCSSIQYSNMNLQSKILLLIETMNHKCNEVNQQIYIDLLQQQILPDWNDNVLKQQALKIYIQFIIAYGQKKPQNRLLQKEIKNKCIDLNSNLLFITQNVTEHGENLTKIIEDFKGNTHKLNMVLKYLIRMKKQFQQELYLNQYIWNEEIFEQYQNSQDGLRSLLYYLDYIYSNISSINTKNETIYTNIVDLLKFITLIVEEIQNTIFVNEKPYVLEGNEIIWQIKRRTKQIFNQQFNIEKTKEDYLTDFVQQESTYLKTNPLRFSSDLVNILQTQFNDQTLQIYSEYYYQILLKNSYKLRFVSSENISSDYSTKFGSYQICSNTENYLQEYKIQCIIRSITGKFYQCNLNRLIKNDTIELSCECNRFGEIFLVISANTSAVISNNNHFSIQDLATSSIFEYLLALQIGTISLSSIFMMIYIYQLLKDQKNKQERLNTEQNCLSPKTKLNKLQEFLRNSLSKYIK
ncbi:unnamed protein product [Paramecium pentaurelia]|uniref:EGF-like domain-containing protein n=1 Tax=Paramecium pentaurelia TaxID=43138 RepID=A0A8S1Y9Q2_9CILI|nr:unnamed protein product [Paramecium pentaurelia]